MLFVSLNLYRLAIYIQHCCFTNDFLFLQYIDLYPFQLNCVLFLIRSNSMQVSLIKCSGSLANR